MAGFFDSAIKAYDNSLNTIMQEYEKANAWSKQQLADPKFMEKTMNQALNFAPIGITAFHGSLDPVTSAWGVGTHFGTARAAMERMLMKAGLAMKDAQLIASDPARFKGFSKLLGGATTHPVDLDIGKVFKATDDVVNSPTDLADLARQQGILSKQEYKVVEDDYFNRGEKGGFFRIYELLKQKGYDALEYINDVEDVGSTSYVLLDPKKAKSFFEAQAAKKGSVKK